VGRQVERQVERQVGSRYGHSTCLIGLMQPGARDAPTWRSLLMGNQVRTACILGWGYVHTGPGVTLVAGAPVLPLVLGRVCA
jgi:hypothetical protein